MTQCVKKRSSRQKQSHICHTTTSATWRPPRVKRAPWQTAQGISTITTHSDKQLKQSVPCVSSYQSERLAAERFSSSLHLQQQFKERDSADVVKVIEPHGNNADFNNNVQVTSLTLDPLQIVISGFSMTSFHKLRQAVIHNYWELQMKMYLSSLAWHHFRKLLGGRVKNSK